MKLIEGSAVECYGVARGRAVALEGYGIDELTPPVGCDSFICCSKSILVYLLTNWVGMRGGSVVDMVLV